MLRLAEVVRRHGPAYTERHGASIVPSHVRAVKSILHCRMPTMGGHVAACPQCGRERVIYHSCRHRACPHCGHDTTTRWLVQQRELLLPVPYFHVVFTLPAELRQLVRSHQTALVPVLFQAAFESLARLCADPHFLGGRIGALAGLHTWTRTLEWHPHVHLLVPGGGLTPDGHTWRAAPPRRTHYLVPVRALSKLLRGRFLHRAGRALSTVAVPQITWSKSWVVFAKPVVQGAEKVLEYLGRYVHRTAISDQGLVGFDDRTVRFRYRDSRDHRRKTMTLPAHEFLRRFLQHVPPKGLHRVRAFGLLHPAHRDTLQLLQLLLTPRQRSDSPTPGPRTRPRLSCPHCGEGSLGLVRRLSPAECIALANALAGDSLVHPPARAPS
ncbi:IS91 family transposase [Sorangium sp. So ce302]|uniref:IS91 family transposase n=1 Tax=Sorangium sp. So ce302 TaxID=3133297 RepID=UPI003F60981A